MNNRFYQQKKKKKNITDGGVRKIAKKNIKKNIRTSITSVYELRGSEASNERCEDDNVRWFG